VVIAGFDKKLFFAKPNAAAVPEAELSENALVWPSIRRMVKRIPLPGPPFDADPMT